MISRNDRAPPRWQNINAMNCLQHVMPLACFSVSCLFTAASKICSREKFENLLENAGYLFHGWVSPSVELLVTDQLYQERPPGSPALRPFTPDPSDSRTFWTAVIGDTLQDGMLVGFAVFEIIVVVGVGLLTFVRSSIPFSF